MPRKPLFKRKADEWIGECRDRMLSAKTVELYRLMLKYAWIHAERQGWPADPGKWQPSHVREWYEASQHLSTSTQRMRVRVLLDFLRWCGNVRVANLRPKITVSRSRVDWLEEEQVAMLLATARSPAVLAMEASFAFTGMRLSEVLQMRVRDVKEREIVVRGKGRKERRVPIDARWWKYQQAYLAIRPQSEHWFAHVWRGRPVPYSVSGLSQDLQRHGNSLGFHLSAHTIRRSFGRHLYKRGCPLVEIKELLGHSSVEQTIRYLGIGDADVAEAVMRYLPEYERPLKVYLTPSGQQFKRN